MNKNIVLIVGVFVLAVVTFFYFNYGMGDKPTVETAEASIGTNGVTMYGIINDSGGREITRYGFKWGTSPELEEEEVFTKPIDVGTSYSAVISGIQEGNTYYYQAYAENSKGLTYGKVKSISIPYNAPPEVAITSPLEGISFNQGKMVQIAAEATDDNKVENIAVYVNEDIKLQVEGNSLSYLWDTSKVAPGEYEIKVIAEDGVKTGERSIKVAVKEEPKRNADQQPIITNTPNKAVPTQIAQINTTSRGITNMNKYPQVSKANGIFGQFRYRDTTGGRIEVDPSWVAENIVTITLPGLNQKVQVHKLAKDAFLQAFSIIATDTAIVNGKEVPLLSLIKTMDGTWVTRHVNWNPSRGLSNHSWGTAIDINAADHFRYVNPSKEPNDPNLILWEKAFKPAGFSWGNRYNDSMHYELIK
ncbi:MAG: Ig-like domain-containing protein [Syntrophomonadaceae bacterium]|jgi:hypothetical protein